MWNLIGYTLEEKKNKTKQNPKKVSSGTVYENL